MPWLPQEWQAGVQDLMTNCLSCSRAWHLCPRILSVSYQLSTVSAVTQTMHIHACQLLVMKSCGSDALSLM